MTYKNEKAQGIVEYALILAFIVGVAVALFNSGWPMRLARPFMRSPRPSTTP